MTKKADNDAERRVRVDAIMERTALYERAKQARRESAELRSRIRDQLHLMWQSMALQCLLVTTADKVIAVQLFSGHRAILTEPCRDADEAAVIAERLWDEFVER